MAKTQTTTQPYTRVTGVDLHLDREEADALLASLNERVFGWASRHGRALRRIEDALRVALRDQPDFTDEKIQDKKPGLI